MEKAEVVELLHDLESPFAKIEAVTENVSSRGVRVITNSIFVPGRHVYLEVPEENLHLPARVVYCQRLEKGKFAIGLQLTVRTEWLRRRH